MLLKKDVFVDFKPQNFKAYNPLDNRIGGMCMNCETLELIFGQNAPGSFKIYQGECMDCGTKMMISVTKTKSGFGFKGGMLHEPMGNGMNLQCEKCFKKERKESSPKKKGETYGSTRFL